jgi:hypothetical protein
MAMTHSFRAVRTLVALALLAAGSVRPAPAASDLDACLAETWPNKRLVCLFDAAKAAGDPDVCLRAAQQGVRWMCVANFAEHANDLDVCDRLPSGEAPFPTIERELCRTHLAIAWHDPTLCAGLATPNLGDSCYLKLVETGSAGAALCARIDNEILKSACAEIAGEER